MDYELISSLKMEELKNYLKAHSLKTYVRRIELIARIFTASGNIVPLVQSAVKIEIELKIEYRNKLIIDEFEVPDPVYP